MTPDLDTPVRDLARPDAVAFVAHESVAEALARLHAENAASRIVYFYVVDEAGRLVGVVPTRRLLFSDAIVPMREIMVQPVVSLRESDSFATALATFTARRLLAFPVVDSDGRLTGVLDANAFTDTLIDLDRRDSADEVFQLAGIQLEDERNRSLARALRNRFPWLLSNVAGGLVAAYISRHFDGLLQAVVALAFFVPLMLTIAESVAMQSLALSLNRLGAASAVTSRDVARELRVGLLLGAGAGLLVAVAGVAWLATVDVAVVVAAGIVLAGGIGATLGFVVPRLVRRWRLNPTVASGPVTLAITDVLTLASYFSIAALALG